ncbi:MAG: UDP-N-acetylglucosamine 2-epimerase [Micavibrio sp.]|nr:UDP-N-acetylglucosamine 2-epimerase [Micavibrio sp.]
MKKKILFIFGTRPEAIKIAPVYLALKDHPKFEPLIGLTGQHPTMAEDILTFFGIAPDFKMELQRVNFSLSEFTAKCLEQVDALIDRAQPDLVFVHGDTASTFGGGLGAYYHRIPVAHLEAGLRTGLKHSPFPEELMRRMTAVLSDYNFAPTEAARDALLKENVSPEHIYVVGNTVIDALMTAVKRLESDAALRVQITDDLKEHGLPDDLGEMILITGHRRENFGDRFEEICNSIRDLARQHPEYNFIYPVHLNPNVQEPVKKILDGIENVYLIPPVNYAHFVYLMNAAHFILTDSGGIQEEAPSLGKPVLIMRDATERPEVIAAGCARLVGTDRIVSAANELIANPALYKQMSQVKNPYGDGQASAQIVKILQDVL